MTEATQEQRPPRGDAPAPPATPGKKGNERPERPEPVPVSREVAEKNLPADPDPDDPVSP